MLGGVNHQLGGTLPRPTVFARTKQTIKLRLWPEGTLGIALVLAVLAVIGREFIWIALPLLLLAIFMIAWGREPRRTEEFVARLPAGQHILKSLRQLDLVLSPRDLEQEEHFRRLLTSYGPLTRQNLRRFLITDDPRTLIYGEWEMFNRDRLVEHPHSGPGGVRPELKWSRLSEQIFRIDK